MELMREHSKHLQGQYSTLNEKYSPPELKIEPRSPPLVLNENTDVSNNVPDVPVNLPKRVYVRKPLPPPRQKEVTRKAFNTALKTEINKYKICKYI